MFIAQLIIENDRLREFHARLQARRRLTVNLLAMGLSFLIGTAPTNGQTAPSARTAASAQERTGAKPGKSVALAKDTRTPAGQNTIGLIGGPPNSTEALIAFQVSSLIAQGQETGPNGELALRVLAAVGNGGAQNIRDLLTLPGVDLAIAPVALVERLRSSGEFGDAARKIVYVAPLHTEEMHLVAGSGIGDIQDLDGKVLNYAGDEAALIAGRELLSALHVQVRWVSIDHRAAAEQISNGTLAATLVLSGKPVASLSAYEKGSGLHLLSIPYSDSLPEGYFPASLLHSDYPDLLGPSEAIETVAVGTALFAYDWPLKSARNRLVADFVRSLFDKMADGAQSVHHPKWQEINLSARLPGWERLRAAQAWLENHDAQQKELAAKQDFEQFLEATGSISPKLSDRDKLFREFQQWRKTHQPPPRSKP